MNLSLSTVAILGLFVSKLMHAEPDYCMYLVSTNNMTKNVCDKNDKKFLIINFFAAGTKLSDDNAEPYKNLTHLSEEIAYGKLISLNEMEQALEFGEKHGIESEILIDEEGLVASLLGVRSFPSLLVLNSENEIIYEYMGVLTQEKNHEIYNFLLTYDPIY